MKPHPLLLPQVTLCAVASIDPVPALRALLLSMRGIRYGNVKLISNVHLQEAPELIEQVRIERFADIGGYSSFMMKNLYAHINTPYVLIVQWDGFVINPAIWETNFLSYDYVGAPWPQFADGGDVGNGGFSLRSRRLLEATADPIISAYHPEDVGICRVHRSLLEERFDIRFAPRDVASRFAFEREGGRETFGFHGSFNFPTIMEEGVLEFIDETPPRLFLNRDGRELCRRLACASDKKTAVSGRKLARQLAKLDRKNSQSWSTLFHTHILRR